MLKTADTIAYFSMEIGLDAAIPTYSGGLGVLAGDTLRAAADMRLPMVAVTLLHRQGYFRQHLDASGNQSESPVVWVPEEVLEPLSARVTVTIEGRAVQVGAWRSVVRGVFGHTVPVYFLDTDLEGNSPWDRTLTDHLYGGDSRYRLCQEVVLGLGGVMMLRALGYDRLQPYHMNEGHAALLTLALLEQQKADGGWFTVTDEDVEAVRQHCVFTTHTPVPAGHDRFPLNLVQQVLGKEWTAFLEQANCCLDGVLDMTYLALYFSRYVNGVAMRHRDVSQGMFPDYPIDAITNGVHAVTWTGMPFRNLYDHHIPGWRYDNFYLRYAVKIPLHDIQYAHTQAKRSLLELVKQRTGISLDEEVLTLGFARRATAYKRADLLFSNLDRLRSMTRQVGPLQIIYGGKAHPRDTAGKALIRRIFAAAAEVGTSVRVVYLQNYDMALARDICAGVDLWLNTPQRPQEASGTSGMKAALNGVPSLSVLDGWWLEGHQEGVTGWAIGDGQGPGEDPSVEVASLYDKLERVVLPLFYTQPTEFAKVMRSAIALNGSFFNAQRMILQYLSNAYFGVES
jgi:starch phosphorylase